MKRYWRVAAMLVLLATQMQAGAAGSPVLAEPVAANSPVDATYLIDGAQVTLRHGVADRPAAPGSACTIRTQVIAPPAYGDIDGDGDSDALLFLLQDTCGSGTFHYVAAAHRVDVGYRGGTAVLIGDRISPRALNVRHGVVIADYLDRAPNEPMATKPVHPRTAYLMFAGGSLQLAGALEPGERIAVGWVTLGHEVRSFEPCADPEPHWLMGESPALGALIATYREAAVGAQPYTPQLMVLAGNPGAPPATGFGADYNAGWRVTRIIGSAPAGHCRSDQIVLTLPARGAVVTSPLEIRGRARGTWFFEGDFPLVLLDGRGTAVARGFASAEGEWMTSDFVPFSATLRFRSAHPGRGRLILNKDNPTGRRERDDALVVPLRLR